MPEPHLNEQIFIDLPIYEELRADDFITMPSNALAVKFINEWGKLNHPKHSLLIGPKGSGKTHLLSIWKEHYQGLILTPESFSLEVFHHIIKKKQPIAIDQIDEILISNPEQQFLLFHFYNLITQSNLSCFLTAQKPLDQWGLSLKDLKTRLHTFHMIEIQAPEDELLTYILIRLFHTRQLMVSSNIISYLVKQMKKHQFNLRVLVNQIDHDALKQKRKITLPFVKEIINSLL